MRNLGWRRVMAAFGVAEDTPPQERRRDEERLGEAVRDAA